MSAFVMRIIGVAGVDVVTGHEGRYLASYSPELVVHGEPTADYVETTDDLAQAKRYPTLLALRDDWAFSIGTRPDGKPDRPLTAFTIEVVQVCESCGKTDDDCGDEHAAIEEWRNSGACEAGPDCDGTRCQEGS